MAEAYCDCTGSPPWPAMTRLHAGGPNRYYLCPRCGAVREDVYRAGAIIEHRWRNPQDDTLPKPVREETASLLGALEGDQLALWGE